MLCEQKFKGKSWAKSSDRTRNPSEKLFPLRKDGKQLVCYTFMPPPMFALNGKYFLSHGISWNVNQISTAFVQNDISLFSSKLMVVTYIFIYWLKRQIDMTNKWFDHNCEQTCGRLKSFWGWSKVIFVVNNGNRWKIVSLLTYNKNYTL
jgi:hypothetical protein